MADNSGIVARGAGQSTAVANLLLDVADNGTLRALSDGEDVSNVEGGLLATVDEGTGMEALGGDESLLAELVPVGVAEHDMGERSTTAKMVQFSQNFGDSKGDCSPASVVDDILHDTTDVAILLGIVEVTEAGGGLVVVGVCFELKKATSGPISSSIGVVGDVR